MLRACFFDSGDSADNVIGISLELSAQNVRKFS